MASTAVRAIVNVPGSKSMTVRALVLNALSTGRASVSHPLVARDSRLMVDALRLLGTHINEADGRWDVAPGTRESDVEIDVGLAGTVMRFAPPIAALRRGSTRFVGDDQAARRPIEPLLVALRQLGVEVDSSPKQGSVPFTVHGRGDPPGGDAKIDASASSQFVTGLLLSGARFAEGVTITHTGTAVPNQPHIEMATAMLKRHGVVVEVSTNASAQTWRVPAAPISPYDWLVEPDLSNATPFLAAAVVTAGSVTIAGIDSQSVQPVAHVAAIFESFGANVELDARGLTVTGGETIHGVDLDLRDTGELTPTVVAMALFADGPTRVRGVEYLRGHESDRLRALAAEATRLGGDVEETDDGLVVSPKPLHGATWQTYHDHRMATAGAIVGLRVPDVEIDDITTTSKTMPDFADRWQRMLS